MVIKGLLFSFCFSSFAFYYFYCYYYYYYLFIVFRPFFCVVIFCRIFLLLFF